LGLFSRITAIVKAKADRAVDDMENPHETLEYAYERQLEMVRKVKQGIVEVATSKKRIELQADRLRADLARLDGQARTAIAANREDLARMALQRKQMAATQLQGLDEQIAQLDAEQQKLAAAEQRMSMKIEAFRTRKEVVKAQYSAAQAQARISESVSGLGEGMADVGMALERAEQKTERLKARAGAIDELVAEGSLESLGGGGDMLDTELARLSAGQSVEDELAQLKAQLPSGGPTKMLPAGGGDGAK
jgi:phage shock protein A